MITNKQLSQGVSIIPVFVSAIVLIIGGSWFITYESYTYTASDDIVDGLVKNSDFNFYLDEVDNSQYDGLDKTGNREDSTISYADSGYEQRGIVFYNLSLIVYAISFIALLSSILIFVRDYELIPNISKAEFSAVTFGSYIAIVIFLLFMASYSVMAIPDAVHEDHIGTDKSCLYDDDMFIAGVDNCDVYFTNDPQIDVINQKSTWSIGLAFIVFFVGMLVPSIYLITSTLERLGEVEDEPEPEPALFFDPEARLLFDINTGEVVGSFTDDDREFFFDEEAMILFDESTGDIVYSPAGLSPVIPVADNVEEDETDTESETEVVESATDVVGLEVVEAESETVETETEVLEAEAEVVEADAEVVEAESEVVEADVEVVVAESEIVEADAKVVVAESEVVEADAEIVEAESEVVEADAEVVGAESLETESKDKEK